MGTIRGPYHVHTVRPLRVSKNFTKLKYRRSIGPVDTAQGTQKLFFTWNVTFPDKDETDKNLEFPFLVSPTLRYNQDIKHTINTFK